jgi:GAF domain-containing protein
MPHDDIVAQARERALRLLNDGAPPREVLTCLVTAAERVAGGGAVSSILVLDKDGLLRNGASPNLPSDYLDAIDRLKPDANVGTCASAAATGRVVETPDFRADEKWAELRHLPLALGFVGAWSMPIVGPGGDVLGTFGTYFRDQRMPSADDRYAIGELAKTAAQTLATEQT